MTGALIASAQRVIWLLRLEGFAAMLLGIAAAVLLAADWRLFVVAALAPDVAILGYLLGPRPGAVIYNAVHTTLGPGLVAAAAWYLGSIELATVAAAWIGHIGADRALGYGLKLPEGFRHTHLGVIGR
jgi:hypothetical protein